MKKYTYFEILRIFDAIDCVTDIQRIADYIAENRSHYPLTELNQLGDLLKAYIEIYA